MQDKDKDLDPKAEPMFNYKRLAKDYVQLSEIQQDPLVNNRSFRKSMEEGVHPLSNVSFLMNTCIKEDPDTAWKAILEMIEISQIDASLAFVAAGPLEDLLAAYPEDFIQKVEEKARQNAKFRKCLSMVWQNTIPEEIWQRIQKITN
jgi:hypothetical protein